MQKPKKHPAVKKRKASFHPSTAGLSLIHISRYLPRSEARMLENKRELCAVVVPYRIPILIRESEMWELGEELSLIHI